MCIVTSITSVAFPGVTNSSDAESLHRKYTCDIDDSKGGKTKCYKVTNAMDTEIVPVHVNQ